MMRENMITTLVQSLFQELNDGERLLKDDTKYWEYAGLRLCLAFESVVEFGRRIAGLGPHVNSYEILGKLIEFKAVPASLMPKMTEFRNWRNKFIHRYNDERTAMRWRNIEEGESIIKDELHTCINIGKHIGNKLVEYTRRNNAKS